MRKHLIVAKYKEDVSWLTKYKNDYNIYLYDKSRFVNNVGREAETYVQFTQTVLCREFYKKKKVLVDGYNPFKEENDRLIKLKGPKIEGGYVKMPEIGLYNILCGQDFASLYPTIMRMFNISPDSYLGQTNELKNKKPELIKDSINTVMNTSFSTETSIMKTLLDDYYGRRKSLKKQMELLEPKIESVKEEMKRRKIKF